MKTTYLPQCSIIANAKPTRRIPYEKIIAGLAVLAWLTLAGQAFSQGTNQWAPVSEAVKPTVVAHVWADGEGAAVYAPSDLDQRLSAGSTRPASQAAQPANPGFSQVTPTFAPMQAPSQMPTAPNQLRQAPATQGQAPMAPQGYGAAYPNMPYGNGPNGMPLGGGYGMLPFVPFNGGYTNGPYGNGPYNNGPYNNGPNGWGNNWGGPGANNSFGGIPFFGGSPFSFW